jgi:hypothetical protein
MTDLNKLNYLNIGLMGVSCLVAFYLPFELFLFAYAILGPAHYLTEISWLHERNYFTKGKRDYLLLGVLSVLIFVCGYVLKDVKYFQDRERWITLSNSFVFIAFFSALILVLLKDRFARIVGVALVCVVALVAKNFYLIFSIFLPTLIHVYVFTGMFILYGALKSRSRSGYLSFAVFLLCPLLFVFIDVSPFMISPYAHKTYLYFRVINEKLYDLFKPTNGQVVDFRAMLFDSSLGIKIMRFIAFAYTYHYLNWFSKTTVIQWHKISRLRMSIIAGIWVVSIALYIYDYKLGFDWLFLISVLHVFLEFPLNHTSFIGIFKEVKALITGKPVAIAVAAKKG